MLEFTVFSANPPRPCSFSGASAGFPHLTPSRPPPPPSFGSRGGVFIVWEPGGRRPAGSLEIRPPVAALGRALGRCLFRFRATRESPLHRFGTRLRRPCGWLARSLRWLHDTRTAAGNPVWLQWLMWVGLEIPRTCSLRVYAFSNPGRRTHPTNTHKCPAKKRLEQA